MTLLSTGPKDSCVFVPDGQEMTLLLFSTPPNQLVLFPDTLDDLVHFHDVTADSLEFDFSARTIACETSLGLCLNPDLLIDFCADRLIE